MHTKLLLEYLKGRDHLGNVGIDESIILTWIQKKWGYSNSVDWIYLAQDRLESCEHNNKPAGSVKGWKFFDR
jgi:hypothetical protein